MNATGFIGTATYSPEDNKLRLYPFSRLSADDYARVKFAGFSWAPKQELFVSPMWTPARADLLEELCGEVDDEDRSLIERAEDRADRFEDYSDKRTNDAETARQVATAAGENPALAKLEESFSRSHSDGRAARDSFIALYQEAPKLAIWAVIITQRLPARRRGRSRTRFRQRF